MKLHYSILSALVLTAGLSLQVYAQNEKQSPVVLLHSNSDGVDEANLVQQLRNSGLSEEEITKQLTLRKQLFEQQIGSPWIKTNTSPMKINASCSEAGVETASWGSWMSVLGTHASGVTTFTATPAAPVTPNFYLTSGIAIDSCTWDTSATPNLPIEFVAPGFGLTSIGLGEPQVTGCVAEQLSFPLLVTAGDTDFTFTYASVIQDPGHAPSDQPYFEIIVLDANGDTIPYSHYLYVGGPSMPGFLTAKCSFGGTYYKPWTIRGLDLAPYFNQVVTIIVTNADCGQCGHFAHSYVDFDCDGILQRKFCPTQSTVPLFMNAEPNSTYLWETGATTQSINAAAIAGDTVFCSVSDGVNNFRIGFNLVPDVSSGYNYTVNGSSVGFSGTSSNAVSWSWIFPGGTPAVSSVQNPTVTFPAGTHTVCLITGTSAGCKDTTCQAFTVTTGVGEYNPLSQITVFASSGNSLVIDAGMSDLGKGTLSVFNLLGEKVFTKNLQLSGRQAMELPQLDASVYFVSITNENNVLVKKLVLR